MIYTEYQQVLLTQLQNNDKRIEEIKKEQEEIQGMFLQESKFKPGDLVQVDYKISNATFKVRGWIFRITFWRNRPYYGGCDHCSERCGGYVSGFHILN